MWPTASERCGGNTPPPTTINSNDVTNNLKLQYGNSNINVASNFNSNTGALTTLHLPLHTACNTIMLPAEATLSQPNVVNIPTYATNNLYNESENSNLLLLPTITSSAALPVLTLPLPAGLLSEILLHFNSCLLHGNINITDISTSSPAMQQASNFISQLLEHKKSWPNQILQPVQMPLPLAQPLSLPTPPFNVATCDSAIMTWCNKSQLPRGPTVDMTHSCSLPSLDLERNLRRRADVIDCLESFSPQEQFKEVLATAAVVDGNVSSNFQKDNVDNSAVDLLPPPKKKWIRHYLTEDAFSSNVFTSSSPNSNNNSSNNAAFVLLPTTAAKNVAEQTQQQPATQVNLLKQQPPNNSKTTTTTFTLIDNGNGGQSPTAVSVGSAAATKQMLLNGGVRIASPAAIIGGTNGSSQQNTAALLAAAKVINISPTQQQQQQHAHAQQTLLSTSYPLYTSSTSNTSSSSSSSSMATMQRHKKCTPLTPPPMPSRKFIETNTRIRSFSLSSHKFTAAAAAAAGSSQQQQQQQQLLLHNGSEDSHMSYVSGGSSGTSPPRHINGGSHYLQMMSSAGVAGSQGGAQPTSLIGGTGRRRTISSNSNGAGTREVHNKLEKNRRAHLKDCYEKLKYQLALPDEDRKKTSNLAILQEALKTVVSLKRQERDLEAQVEQQAKEKINAQKKIVSLKRELGPKFEQYFAGIMPDVELGSIPVERENVNDTGSLSSGRGSLLYSSSSSLSSGGSSNNTVSSPVGAGLQTTMPTALSPVISQKITTNNSTVSSSCVTTSTSSAAITAPISPTILQQLKSSTMTNAASVVGNGGVIGIVSHGSGGISVSPTATTTINGIVNVTMPLSLTAKNISATSLTRGSPTPSTPSPSPSSSSGVSSSSSIISSSPPMNGVINGGGRNGNIPNGLKFQTTATAVGGGNATLVGTTVGTLSNGTTATIIATAPAGNATAVVNSNNNANPTATITTTAAIGSTISNSNNSPQQQQQQQHYSTIYGRKKNFACITNNSSKNCDLMEGEQPAKIIKIYNNNNSISTTDQCNNRKISNNAPTTTTATTTLLGPLQLSQVVGGGSLVVSPYLRTVSSNQSPQMQKFLINDGSHANELGRLPGGADLNILPNSIVTTTSANSCTTTTTQMNGNSSVVNGSKMAEIEQTPSAGDSTVAFFHANGKLTLVNGGSSTNSQHTTSSGSNGIMLNGESSHRNAATTTTFALSNGNLVQLTPATATTLHFGANVGNLMPMVVSSPQTNNLSGNNFAQLIAAANVGNQVTETSATSERLNGRLNFTLGGAGGGGGSNGLPIISTQYLGSMKPIVVTVAAPATSTAELQLQQTTNFPTLTQTLINPFPLTTTTSSSASSARLSATTATTSLSTITTTATVKTVPPIISSSTKSLIVTPSSSSASSSFLSTTSVTTSTNAVVTTGTTNNGNAL